MKETLNLSQSTTYLDVPNMCRGQYKMCPNSWGSVFKRGGGNFMEGGKTTSHKNLIKLAQSFQNIISVGGKSHGRLDKS